MSLNLHSILYIAVHTVGKCMHLCTCMCVCEGSRVRPDEPPISHGLGSKSMANEGNKVQG